MDSPWSNDFKALSDKTRERLPSVEATRTALSTRSTETKMRFFKSHPALAAIVALLALSLVGGVAYAVVREVFVTVDPTKPAEEIQKDMQSQLQAAGVNATVQADKNDDGRLKIRVSTEDPHVGSDVKITIKGMPEGAEQRQLRLELQVKCELTDEQKEALTNAVSGDSVHKLVLERGDKSDADVATDVQKLLADAGFTDTEVNVSAGSLAITIKSPPK